ncbi:MAG: hypothetical protein L0Y58_02745 [Verrucomicrobia subdivision 3 bacterium]|nr:hypothetical protein [Limisphaerales bacterium]
MRTLSQREKRTIRMAGIGIAVYLVVFFGIGGWKRIEAKRAEYHDLLARAERLKREVQPYENRVLLAQKLKENFKIDPQKLVRATLVADASAAIQKAAQAGGVQLGPIRESAGRASAREMTSIQMEGTGQVPAVAAFLHQIGTLGFPLIVESVQLNPEKKPGMLKMNLNIVILDFEQWKKEPSPNA